MQWNIWGFHAKLTLRHLASALRLIPLSRTYFFLPFIKRLELRNTRHLLIRFSPIISRGGIPIYCLPIDGLGRSPLECFWTKASCLKINPAHRQFIVRVSHTSFFTVIFFALSNVVRFKGQKQTSILLIRYMKNSNSHR